MTKEISEGNKLIAEFMELKSFEDDRYGIMWTNPVSDGVYEKDTSELKYHKSWDWLMPVLEKIEDLDHNPSLTHTYRVDITGNGTTIQPNVWSGERWMIRRNSRNNRLWNTWLSIIQFIKWYNEKCKK